MHKCYLCQSDALKDEVNLGNQPISNRFLSHPEEAEFLTPMAIVQCQSCGLIQIKEAAPAEQLRPPYDWITYNEPEPHLDQLADTIAGLPDLGPEDGIWGVSFKDDSLLRRMEARGFKNTYRLDMKADLEIPGEGAGAETIQNRLTPERMAIITAGRARPKLVIARHIIEHAHDFQQFMRALQAIVLPDGYVVLEAPDCQRALELLDYTTLWEEHTIYFTPDMFRMIFPFYGMERIYSEVFPYAFENSIVGIGRMGYPIQKPQVPDSVLIKEKARMADFSASMPKHKARFAEAFRNYTQQTGKIALFGAGHLACAFINYLELKDYVSFVVDDNPHKQGLWMPGCRIPIQPSPALLEQEIKLALFSLSPEVEDKVVAKNKPFLEKGGVFASIFPASARAMKVG